MNIPDPVKHKYEEVLHIYRSHQDTINYFTFYEDCEKSINLRTTPLGNFHRGVPQAQLSL